MMKIMRKLMKFYYLLIGIMFFISCEENKIIFNYPDCINKPDHVNESFGCGNIFIYQYLDSLTALTVRLNGNKLNLTQQCQTVELNNFDPNISVLLEISGNDPDSIYFNFCDDVAYLNIGKTKKYKATSGKLFYTVSEDDPIKNPIWDSNYYVTIKIVNLHVYNQKEDKEIIIDKIVFWNVLVGWMPG